MTIGALLILSHVYSTCLAINQVFEMSPFIGFHVLPSITFGTHYGSNLYRISDT